MPRAGEILVPNNAWRPVTLSFRAKALGPAPVHISIAIDDTAAGSCVALTEWQACGIRIDGPAVYPRVMKAQLVADAPVRIAEFAARQHIFVWHTAGLACLGGLAGLLVWSAAPSRTAPRGRMMAAAACAIVFAACVVRTAWISDDAYITLRTIENIFSGHGPRWNAAERVQAYTHPLWLMLLVPARWLAGEPYMAVMAMSIATALAAFLLIGAVSVSGAAALVAMLSLLLSRAFVEFSTGGLENPLTCLLLGIFYRRYWTNATRGADVVLVFLGALLALSRLDAVLLVLPALALNWLRGPTWRSRTLALAGLVPLLVWELFSFWYYGSLTPNTALAKLHTGVPARELLSHGLGYLDNCLRHDPMTIGVAALAAIVAVTERTTSAWMVVAGIALYYAYIVSIGGDFMVGRFLAAPAYAAALLVARARLLTAVPAPVAAAAAAAILIAGHAGNRGPSDWLRGRPGLTNFVDARGWLADERANYYRPLGLLSSAPLPDPAMDRGRLARAEPRQIPLASAVGMFGFYAGPSVHVLDTVALGDPLLARLYSNRPWRPGHFQRPIPDGYIETLQTGTNRIRDPRMRQFYDLVHLVVRGPLGSLERLRVAAGLAAGRYEPLAPKEVVAIDRPEHESTQTGQFVVDGFAADFSVQNGTGVHDVGVYAYPVALLSARPAGHPVPLQPVTYRLPRPDVGRTYGSRFIHVGYAVTVPAGLLEPGTYDIAAFAKSDVTGLFNSRSIRIHVR
jgi:arabinofuranosyltransferase